MQKGNEYTSNINQLCLPLMLLSHQTKCAHEFPCGFTENKYLPWKQTPKFVEVYEGKACYSTTMSVNVCRANIIIIIEIHFLLLTMLIC